MTVYVGNLYSLKSQTHRELCMVLGFSNDLFLAERRMTLEEVGEVR